MTALRRIINSRLLAMFAGAAIVAGGGYAVAATSSKTIKACASKRSGALRIASRCHKSERAVRWSVTGPKGAPGANGTNGTNGTNGANGAPAVLNSTTLSWGGGTAADTHGDLTFRENRTIGTFSKSSATTHVLVTVNGSMSSDAYSCVVQVRVDGKDAAGNAGGTFSNTSNPGATGIRGTGAALQAPYSGSIVQSFSITADFGALSTGTHTLSLWLASNDASNNCETDPYNYRAGSAVVLETGV